MKFSVHYSTAQRPPFSTTLRIILLLVTLLTVTISITLSPRSEPIHDAAPGSGYGVGFHLAMDYGTASVYFANGTYVDIAKVEGSAAYKQTMRNTAPHGLTMFYDAEPDPAGGIPDFPDELQPIVSMATDQPHSLAEQPLQGVNAHGIWFFSPFRSVIEGIRSWRSRDESANGLIHMFSALKATTESFLEHPISVVDMTRPWALFDNQYDLFRDLQTTAWRITGIQRQQSAQLAGPRAIDYYGKPSTCVGYDAPRADQQDLILTVDYSRAALTTNLFHEYCAFSYYRRTFHSSQLGVEGLRRCHDTRGSQACRADLKAAIYQVAKMPEPDEDPNFPKSIGRIVIMGESAADPLLSEVLHEVLRETGSSQFMDASNYSSVTPKTEPLFVASRAIAKWSWKVKEQ